jgi:phosphohistidine phosphatase
MKTIVIARHAKSDWATGLPDHDRPLNSRGKLDAPRMGRALEELSFKPDLIISSSAIRAKATAEAVAREIGFHQSVKIESKLYEAGHGMITGMLQALPDAVNNAMLFGHNPILEQLVAHLLQMKGNIVIPTSGMVCLEANIYNWSALQPGESSLKWFLIPKLLS